MHTYLQPSFAEAGEHHQWQMLFQSQMKSVAGSASDEFILGLQRVGFRPGHMPELPALNRKVEAATGWQLKPVAARPAPLRFFGMLAAKQFPIRTDFSLAGQREGSQPGYFEDVFGYVPLLTNVEYADFLQRLGRLGEQYADTPHALALVWRLALHIMDYGFVRESRGVHALGGRLLANAPAAFWAEVPMRCIPLDVETAVATPLSGGLQQPIHFVADGFSDLRAALTDVPDALAEAIRTLS